MWVLNIDGVLVYCLPVDQLIITLLVSVGDILVFYSSNTLVCFTWFSVVDINPVSLFFSEKFWGLGVRRPVFCFIFPSMQVALLSNCDFTLNV